MALLSIGQLHPCAPALLGSLSLPDLPKDGPEDSHSPCTVWIYSLQSSSG